MTARQRRLNRPREIQRERSGAAADRKMRAWFARLGPWRCERCGLADAAVGFEGLPLRGWYHRSCAEAERADLETEEEP